MLKAFTSLISSLFFFAVVGFIAAIAILWSYGKELPDYRQLAKYEPSITTRLYAADGQLLTEYAYEKRLFLQIDRIPDRVKQAFISAEDKNFYSHSGVDFTGVLRAVVINIRNLGVGRRLVGASTITQQVAKNFLLSSEVSYTRKIKEAILAFRIEHAFEKDHILELYLNEIYLGNRSFGVAAAALNYFNKSLSELSLSEIAYLAALPKGPNNYNPKTKYEAAIARRNWVIQRMVEEGYVTQEEADIAKQDELVTVKRNNEFVKYADYFSEEVRREVTKSFGDDALYEDGLIIRTTLDPKLQKIAYESLQSGLEEYDRRHGYRGPVTRITVGDIWEEELLKIKKPNGADENWKLAVVLDVKTDRAEIGMAEGEKAIIPISLLKWARETIKDQKLGDTIYSVKQIFAVGDVVLVEKATPWTVKKKKLSKNSYELRQVPNVEGAIIAIDPHTGRVLAMSGGYSFNKSQFNRATQAKRQTGSVFKPFVYLTALEEGYSPTDLILDAPFVLDQGYGLPKWKPVNYSTKFYGPMPLRYGVEKSKNLMTVRLAQEVGMDKISNTALKFGVNNNMPHLLSMSLGAGDAKLIDVTSAYGSFVNGGKKIMPFFVDRIQNKDGKTIYKQDKRECADCFQTVWENQKAPILEDVREKIIDEKSAYQITSILEGVATRGTGRRLKWLNKTLGGKTGTTNKNQDAWFVGFSPDLVVGVYVGFDVPRTLGRYETGSKAANPVFYKFMKAALKNKPKNPFRIPSGMKLIRVNYETGLPAKVGDKIIITEALKPENKIGGENRKVIGGGVVSKSELETQEEDEIKLGNEY